MKNRSWRIVLSIIILSALSAGFLYYLKTSRSVFATEVKEFAYDVITDLQLPRPPKPVSDKTVLRTIELDAAGKDTTKYIYDLGNCFRFYDKANGFLFDLPNNGHDFSLDAGLAEKIVKLENDDYKITVTREWTVGDDTDAYIDYYFNRFILDEGYRNKNDIELILHEKANGSEILTVRLNGLPDDKFEIYTYAFIKTNTRFFYRLFYNYHEENHNAVLSSIESFQYFATKGSSTGVASYTPILPDWTGETSALYESMASGNSLTWGIFTSQMTTSGIDKTIPELEQSLDYKFGVVLAYAHLNEAFPVEFMNKCAEQNRVVELTYQLTTSNNEDLFGKSPLLDIYKNGVPPEVTAFAEAAKAFSKPFYFRLNNEMNSDWTSYSGVNNLSDPDIFIDVWRQIYNEFKRVGVSNAIWIFNPNDRDCPPANWNYQKAYFPGGEYAQMIGITGYNNGSYYADVFAERWREFDEIYETIRRDFRGMYDGFPWMITEFASSSIGGDKARWIDKMFKALPKYENIKIAVWFSYADYDFREGLSDIPARPYWLDETEETMNAFKKGVH